MGDCAGGIHVWRPGSGGTWAVSEKSYASHTASVEDVRWSPNEANVLVSCSVDKTLKVWDVRADPSKACMLTQAAHASDVNGILRWRETKSRRLLLVMKVESSTDFLHSCSSYTRACRMSRSYIGMPRFRDF